MALKQIWNKIWHGKDPNHYDPKAYHLSEYASLSAIGWIVVPIDGGYLIVPKAADDDMAANKGAKFCANLEELTKALVKEITITRLTK